MEYGDRLELNDKYFNFLCEHFALTTTPQMHEVLKKLGFDNVGDLAKHIQNYKTIELDYAFLSGLIQGWKEALKDPNQVGRVINDMNEMSIKLAEKGGIKVESE